MAAAIIELHPVKCPRCGKVATLIQEDAIVGFHNPQPRNVYGCDTCTTPFYTLADTVEYAPFQFLSDGSEVI